MDLDDLYIQSATRGEIPLRDVLFWLASSGNVEGIKQLVNNGAALDIKDNDDSTLIHIAVLNGNIELVEFLIENNLDYNAIDKYGKKPIDYAISSGNTKCQKILEALTDFELSREADEVEFISFLYEEIGELYPGSSENH